MAFTDQIHWSFQYDGRSQAPHFGKQLMAILNRGTSAPALRQTDQAQDADRYTVLPNYWKGYKRVGEMAGDCDLAIGEAVIDRRCEASGNWRYEVRYVNATSGENLHLDFCCADDDFRTLRDTWRVTARNGAGDGYRQFAGEGRITSRGDFALVVNDVVLPIGRFDGSRPVTCNWTLFDVIPNLAHRLKASGEQVALGILEDLEKVRARACIGFLEDWVLPLDEEALELSGFFVYGVGMLPSHWWVDQQGRVVIASTTFQTFALAGGAA